jgi:hypothetical protein
LPDSQLRSKSWQIDLRVGSSLNMKESSNSGGVAMIARCGMEPEAAPQAAQA